MNKIFSVGLLFSFTASLAFAHGDEQHAKKKFDLAKAEQKEFGIAGDPKKATKTINVAMGDNMRFTPNEIQVKQGDTVKLIVTNKGKIKHEMVLGSAKELAEHAQLMKKFPDMEHEEPHMAHVKPGATETIVWTFNKPGEFEYVKIA